METLRKQPSSSGARVSGDDYQHLFTWMNALKLVSDVNGASKIRFEVNAGNVDDLVVHPKDGPPVYSQIKFVMSQNEPLTHNWFTVRPRRGANTPLQRFYDSMKTLTIDGIRPNMALQTNRLPAAKDAVLVPT